jgi:hypothetical protein
MEARKLFELAGYEIEVKGDYFTLTLRGKVVQDYCPLIYLQDHKQAIEAIQSIALIRGCELKKETFVVSGNFYEGCILEFWGHVKNKQFEPLFVTSPTLRFNEMLDIQKLYELSKNH